MDDWAAQLARLDSESARIAAGGGPARRARHARLGRASPRARIEALVDAGGWLEIGRHQIHQHADLDPRLAATRAPGDGIVCVMARIAGQSVAVVAHDATVLRGAVGSAGADKLRRLYDWAIAESAPVITLADSDGARVAEGVHAVAGWTGVLERIVHHRSHAPQLTVAYGLCVGAAAYAATLGDFVAMVQEQSFMFLTGPTVTRAMTGEAVDIADLGGAQLHAERTGACHAVLPDEAAGPAWVRGLLSYLTAPKTVEVEPSRMTPLTTLIPVNPRRSYDPRRVLAALFDGDSLMELSGRYAASLLTHFARLGGRSVAVLTSNPSVRAGCLDIESARKGAHFLRFAQDRGLPVITVVDTAGFVPGVEQERGGVLVHGAELLRAYATLTVPTLSLTLRKSYGGANVLSAASRHRLALPTAVCAPMGAIAAARVALGPAADPDELRAFQDRWTETCGDAWSAAASGFFDAVIAPSSARDALLSALNVVDAR